MIFYKQDRALPTETLQSWYGSLSSMERMAWSWVVLSETLSRHNYCYFNFQGRLSSLILFQSLPGAVQEVLFLATAPEYRGHGHMSALLKSLQSTAGDIWLECREDNQAAIGLYRKLGFVGAGRRDAYYRDGTAAILFNF